MYNSYVVGCSNLCAHTATPATEPIVAEDTPATTAPLVEEAAPVAAVTESEPVG